MRIDSAEATHRLPPAEPVRTELPHTVLRLPEIAFESSASPAGQIPAPQSADAENDRLKIICVAAALVLLAVLFFSTAEQAPNRPPEPLPATPLVPAATSPELQTAPPWQSPVVSVPPAPETASHGNQADPPAYRTADRSAASGDRYSQPNVRFEGSIEKQTPDIHHERP